MNLRNKDSHTARPLISVIMPVYNAEAFLKESIESILNQTYKNFEFIIIEDGSADKSPEIIKQYANKDYRIKFYKNLENTGYVRRLNEGLKLAKGKYVARMDADDISLPKRFEKQIERLEQDSKLAVVGSSAFSIDENGKKLNKWILNSDPEQTKTHFLFTNYVIHPSVIMRKSMIPKNGYREEFMPAEDFDLWVRIIKKHPISSISKPLLKYQIHPNNISGKKIETTFKLASKILERQLIDLGLNPTKKEIEIHHLISDFRTEYFNLEEVDSWFQKLWEANKKSGKYKKPILLSTILGRRLIFSRKEFIKFVFSFLNDLSIKDFINFFFLSSKRLLKYLLSKNVNKLISKN